MMEERLRLVSDPREQPLTTSQSVSSYPDPSHREKETKSPRPGTSKRALTALGPWPRYPSHLNSSSFCNVRAVVFPAIPGSRPEKMHRRVTNAIQQTHLPTTPTCYGLVQLHERER